MSRWSIDPEADVPPSRQLVEAVLDAITRGELEPGSQLPSVRAMAAEAMVNHNTVARAYLELQRLGVTEGINGVGVFVTPRGPEVAAGERRTATDARIPVLVLIDVEPNGFFIDRTKTPLWTGFEHALKATCFLTDISEFSRFNDVYRRYVGDEKPARSTIECKLAGPAFKVEVDMVVGIPRG